MKHHQNLNRPSGMTKWPQSQPLGFQNEDDQVAVTVEPAWASRNKHMDRALSEMIRPLSGISSRRYCKLRMNEEALK